MNFQWKKLGLLYCPSETSRHSKLLSHAANPLPVLMDGDIYRIFYSGRDANNRSSVGAVDMDIVKRKIIEEHRQPFFEHGSENSFFADGVSIGNCYEVDNKRYMLFMGWQSPQDGHWRGDIGRLVVKSDLSLELDSHLPFLSSDDTDPISLSYPWVCKQESGGFSMWYGSTTTWDAGNGEMLHVLKSAVSADGHHWVREGLAVPYEIGKAQAFSRPTVIFDKKNGYDMWFSYRSGTGEKYRIGHAICQQGEEWKLDLTTGGLDVSHEGWDSEMVEYPFVFSHQGQNYMLYNGNNYGKSGFGLAVMEKS